MEPHNFFPDSIPDKIPPPPPKKSRLYNYALSVCIYVSTFIGDVWRLVISICIATFIYALYTFMPLNILAWTSSVWILYKFGAYTIKIKTK